MLGNGWAGAHFSIEKYAARFAERGLVAIVIDYRGWGYSDGFASLVERLAPPADVKYPDEVRFTTVNTQVSVKRTRLLPQKHVEDYRNAISFLQGEPGVDQDRIGIWGTSFAGGHIVQTAALDSRVKAVVGQIPAIPGRNAPLGPVPLEGALLEDAVKRARTGQGAEFETGYSMRRMVDLETSQAVAEYRPFQQLKQVDPRPVLFIVAAKEELFDNRDHGYAALEILAGPKKLVEVPGITHFEMYIGTAFELSSTAAADWFLEHLTPQRPQNAADDVGPAVGISDDLNDWPMYNRDVIGTRHNAGEKALRKDNVDELVEKWRFPAADSGQKIGIVHATVVVNGHVYFGTETNPAVYKLTPDGKLKWRYPPRGKPQPDEPAPASQGLPVAGFLNCPLVTNDSVYIGDLLGTIYALDRSTGNERWKVSSRSSPFPSAHPSNCVFSSPILAENKLVVAGGAFEHAVGAAPDNRGCTGRGFVVALEPHTGNVIWKYNVGPEAWEFDAPVTIKDTWGEHIFYRGPSTSSVWCVPSYDAATRTIYFGTDCHNSPRKPTSDDPRLSTPHSCAVIAIGADTGAEKWVTQINPDDVWNYDLRAYDPQTGRYKDQSVGDTPKVYTIQVAGGPTSVVGCGCKNGGFYVLEAATGKILHHTPIYTGPPVHPPPHPPELDPRTLALPSTMGGLQTGCATDGKAIYTNGIDILRLATNVNRQPRYLPPTGGRVVSISLDTRTENWRHERPKVPTVGGTAEKPAFTDVGDPVASGIAIANGVAYFTTVVSNKLVALDTATGSVLKEIDINEPVWCGPVVSRGRVYVGTGNLLFAAGNPQEAYFPKSVTGVVISFGLPDDDEVSLMGSGSE